MGWQVWRYSVFILATLFALSTIVLSSPLSPTVAAAAVPCGDVTSLIAAIVAANSDPDLTTIELGDSCLYAISTVDSSDANGATGLPTITSPIVIEGHKATIRGDGSTLRLFLVDGGSLTLNQVTLESGATLYGGNVFSSGGTLTLVDTTVRSGSASYGAGIYATNSTVTLMRSTLSENTASESGGGLMSVNS